MQTKSKREISFFLILIISLFLTYFVLKYIQTNFLSLKIKNTEQVSFTIEKKDENYLRIKPIFSNLQNFKMEKEVINDNTYLKNFPIILSFKPCGKSKIYPILRDKTPTLSQRISISPETDKLYYNAILVRSNEIDAYFLGFDIHKNNIECINDIVHITNGNLPSVNYLVIKKETEDKKNKSSKKFFNKLFFSSNEINFMQENIKLTKNNLIINSFLKKNDDKSKKDYSENLYKNYSSNSPGTYSKIFLKDIIVLNYIIDDVLLVSKQDSNINNIKIKCNVTSGGLVFLIYHPDTQEVYDRRFCFNNKNILLNLKDRPDFNFLISSYLNPYTPMEISLKLKFSFN